MNDEELSETISWAQDWVEWVESMYSNKNKTLRDKKLAQSRTYLAARAIIKLYTLLQDKHP